MASKKRAYEEVIDLVSDTDSGSDVEFVEASGGGGGGARASAAAALAVTADSDTDSSVDSDVVDPLDEVHGTDPSLDGSFTNCRYVAGRDRPEALHVDIYQLMGDDPDSPAEYTLLSRAAFLRAAGTISAVLSDDVRRAIKDIFISGVTMQRGFTQREDAGEFARVLVQPLRAVGDYSDDQWATIVRDETIVWRVQGGTLLTKLLSTANEVLVYTQVVRPTGAGTPGELQSGRTYVFTYGYIPPSVREAIAIKRFELGNNKGKAEHRNRVRLAKEAKDKLAASVMRSFYGGGGGGGGSGGGGGGGGSGAATTGGRGTVVVYTRFASQRTAP